MEQAVGMETALFGGPPELGNMLKLANGQIGFMAIFAHPLFANVADVIPAMRFAADEILTNKGVWFTRAEHEKKMQLLRRGAGARETDPVSPRTQSPAGRKPSRNELPTSPLRGRNDSPESAGRGSDARRSSNNTPQNTSRPSSLAAAAGIAISANDFTTKTSGSTKSHADLRSSNDPRKSGKLVVNGDHGLKNEGSSGTHWRENKNPTASSTPRQTAAANDLSPDSLSALTDTRRDEAVSMRAGSEAIPAEALEVEKKQLPTISDASKFKFATSRQDEPVRTYTPGLQYSAAHASARASAPASDHEMKQQSKNLSDGPQPSKSAHSETTLRGGDDRTLTPSMSIGATSNNTSEPNDDISRNHNGFHDMRNRAVTAPTQSPSPRLRPSFSMGSNSATSRESSKLDIHTTILRNGEVDDGSARDRKINTRTMGRKRSKLKLAGLAFWKRSRSDKSVGGDERPDSQGS